MADIVSARDLRSGYRLVDLEFWLPSMIEFEQASDNVPVAPYLARPGKSKLLSSWENIFILSKASKQVRELSLLVSAND